MVAPAMIPEGLLAANMNLSVDGHSIVTGSGAFPGRGAPGKDTQMFYRRADGWICKGPAWDTARAKRILKGMIPLSQYGYFYNTNNPSEPGGPWKPTTPDDEYRRIFNRGGAHEFCLEQIVAAGWHLKPPYPGVEFLQLDGVQIDEVECSTCRKKFYALTGATPAAAERLAAHESIVHKEASQSSRLGRAIVDASKETSSTDAVLEALTQQQELMRQALLQTQEQMARQNEVLIALLQQGSGGDRKARNRQTGRVGEPSNSGLDRPLMGVTDEQPDQD